jgi:4-amino-4-deoxy-L-arabinose transferase-like glycosyltransferase
MEWMNPPAQYDTRGGHSRLAALCFFCVLFLLQVLPYLSYRWVADESWYSIPALNLLQEGRLRNPVFAPTDTESKVDTHPPGTALSIALAFKIFGVGVAQARTPSLLAALGTVVAAFFLGSLLAGRLAGTLAGLLTAADNFLFLSARTARPEAYDAFFVAAAVLLFFYSRRANSFWLALLSALCLGVGINYHVTVFGVAASFFVLLVVEFRSAVWRQRRAWALVLGLAISIAPFVLWIRSSSVNYQAFRQMYVARGESASLQEKLEGESVRYSDLLGFTSQRFGLPTRLPLRLHIVGAILCAFAVLFFRARNLFYQLLALVLPTLIWWVYLVNKSSRYFAILAAILAVVLGAAAEIAFRQWRRRQIVSIVLVTLVLSQIAGNVVFLYKARTADYVAVSAALQKLIPPGSSAYGTITFWMALYNRSYFAWERTPLEYATKTAHPSYVIMNDRVMMHGSGFGEDDYKDLREDLTRFVHENGVLIGKISSQYYGDLEIYDLRRRYGP